jgi:galactokinase
VTGPVVAAPVWYPLPSSEQAVTDVTAAFVAEFGHPPDGVWAAPGRVNVIGEHVDYNAGLCLPFALPQRTFVALSARDDDTVRVRSLQVTALDSDQGTALDSAQVSGRPDRGRWEGRLVEVAPGRVRG